MKPLKHTIIMTLLLLFSFLPVFPGEDETGPASKNIEAFTRLYGYVKYFYPGDEAAGIDWDRFAVYGVKRVKKARDRAELKKILEELFSPVAPALVIHETGKKIPFSLAGITPPVAEKMKPVVWQHLGVGFGNPQDIYRSIRLNRPDELALKNSFAPLGKGLDVALYRGKKIKLTAAVKVLQGIGQLWLRADKPGKQPPFFKDMDENPIRINQWKNYEITAHIPDDAIRIQYGCLLVGAGQMWTDDFQLYVKEKENSPWEPVTIQNPGFEDDNEGAVPRAWDAQNELYSFRVTAATAAKGNKSVTIESKPPPPAKPLFAERPRIGEHIAKELGSGLSCVMPIALYGTETRTFPPAAGKDLNRLKTAIKQEVPQRDHFQMEDLYVRLAGIVVSWNVFRHFYPYFAEAKSDWQGALTEALAAAFKDRTELDFLETLKQMTGRLNDGQAGAYLSANYSRMYLPPINWAWVQGQLVITDIYDKTTAENDLEADVPGGDVRVGDVVVAVDGEKAGEALAKKERGISGATSGWKRFRALEELLRGKENSKIHLKIKRERPHVFYNETVTRSAFSPNYFGYVEKRKPQTREIAEGIFYLNLDLTPMAEIKRLMPQLQKARSIICDFRGSPKGSHLLLPHLLKESDRAKLFRIPQVIYPDYENVTYRNVGWLLEPLKPRLTAKMIFIVDNRTMDYGESILNYIRHHKLGTIVGQPTAGTGGRVHSFSLLGKYFIRWTAIKMVKHDGSPHHGIGIIPQVLVERTLKGVKEGRDELLEKALSMWAEGPQ